jgi:hypothetical protein
MDKIALNRLKTQNEKLKNTINIIYGSHKGTELCRGDEICCGRFRPVTEFSSSNLKCICKECTKNIRLQNRWEKIDKNEDHYIYEKIRSEVLRVSISLQF